MSGYTGWRDADVSKLGANVQPRNKFNARKVTIDGQRFDSKHEAAVWQELRAEQAAGAISGLERQRTFPLVVLRKSDGQPTLIGRFTADFICRRNGRIEVVDAKGGRATKTEAYQLRKRLFEALYDLTIQER